MWWSSNEFFELLTSKWFLSPGLSPGPSWVVSKLLFFYFVHIKNEFILQEETITIRKVMSLSSLLGCFKNAQIRNKFKQCSRTLLIIIFLKTRSRKPYNQNFVVP